MDRNSLGYLADLNRSVEAVLSLLGKLAEYPELQDDHFTVLQVYFREHLADTNLAVISALEVSEQDMMEAANRERAAYERQLIDSDDCYRQVMKREEELRRRGKPSKIGILLGMRKVTTEEIMNSPFEEEEAPDRLGESPDRRLALDR